MSSSAISSESSLIVPDRRVRWIFPVEGPVPIPVACSLVTESLEKSKLPTPYNHYIRTYLSRDFHRRAGNIDASWGSEEYHLLYVVVSKYRSRLLLLKRSKPTLHRDTCMNPCEIIIQCGVMVQSGRSVVKTFDSRDVLRLIKEFQLSPFSTSDRIYASTWGRFGRKRV